jgi:3-oxoacyl-[acyl-carrier protein] reductase
MPMTLALKGKVALVTGGAGGLGRAICEALAGSGASVVVGYNSSAGTAQALAERLPRPATEAEHVALQAAVTDTGSLARLAKDIEGRHGRCDIVVNCAGTTRFVAHANLDGLDDSLFDDIFATNVRGPFAVVRALRPLLHRSGNGLVVNISSIAAVTAMGSNIAYCASKAAVDNMTKSLARALAPQIRVLSVSPGLSDTDFVKQLDPTWRDEQADRTPLKRLARPDEVAAAVVAAATLLTFTTGVVIPVDGGRPLQ